jgi:short-subunit dehydrogenase
VNTRGYFKDISIEEVREMALVNTYPYSLLTKAILPKMEKGSMIINICSVISQGPSAYDALYAATKVFEVYTFESMRHESPQYRFLTMNPQYVSTNNARLPPGGVVETTEVFVKSILGCIGKDIKIAVGTKKHEIVSYFQGLMHKYLGPYNL